MLTLDPALTIAIFTVIGIGFLIGVIFLSWAVRPLSRPKRTRIDHQDVSRETYESGFPAQGDARSIGFLYLNYAALFLIFDVAALFLFLYLIVPSWPSSVTVSLLLGLATLGLLILYGAKRRKYYVA